MLFRYSVFSFQYYTQCFTFLRKKWYLEDSEEDDKSHDRKTKDNYTTD